MGWHGDYYWSGLVWYTRPKREMGRKCVGTGLTIEDAEADLKAQLINARSLKIK